MSLASQGGDGISCGLEAGCPACGANSRESLLTLDLAPLSCGRLYSSPRAALGAGQCRVEIVLCVSCTHIWNAAYRADSGTPYDDDYYSSFIASSQAREYQVALARDFDRVVGLEGKTVLEIGCGDGFFLQTVSSFGARAIGYEPSGTFKTAVTQPGIEVVHELFKFDGTQALDLNIDVVVMRHALEHFVSPTEVLRVLARSCFGGLPPQFLLLEVPNSFQLLKDNLYFDFYNDHIHYFSDASLDQVLGQTGWRHLDRISLSHEFVKLVATNAASKPPQSSVLDDNGPSMEMNAFLSAARSFHQRFGPWKDEIMRLVKSQMEQGNRVAIWGAGARGVALLAGLGLPEGDFAYIVDSDPNKQGKYLPRNPSPIYSPEQLRADPVDCILVTSHTYFDEIMAGLGWFREADGKIIRVYPTPEII